MIVSADADLGTIVWASLRYSISSTVIASLIGIPTGIALSTSRWRFKRFVAKFRDCFFLVGDRGFLDLQFSLFLFNIFQTSNTSNCIKFFSNKILSPF